MMTERFNFAYGSNMDERQMEERCRDAVFWGKARLSGYRFIINTRGVATVIPLASSDVYGVLWSITASCEKSLDECEGVRRGTYSKRMVDVCTDRGELFHAMIYIASNSTCGSSKSGYIERIIAAAKKHGLPDAYIEELKSWA